MNDFLDLGPERVAKPFTLRRYHRSLRGPADTLGQHRGHCMTQQIFSLAGSYFLTAGEAEEEFNETVIQIRFTKLPAKGHRQSIIHAQDAREFCVSQIAVKSVSEPVTEWSREHRRASGEAVEFGNDAIRSQIIRTV